MTDNQASEIIRLIVGEPLTRSQIRAAVTDALNLPKNQGVQDVIKYAYAAVQSMTSIEDGVINQLAEIDDKRAENLSAMQKWVQQADYLLTNEKNYGADYLIKSLAYYASRGVILAQKRLVELDIRVKSDYFEMVGIIPFFCEGWPEYVTMPLIKREEECSIPLDYYTLGISFHQNSRHEEAMRLFRKAVGMEMTTIPYIRHLEEIGELEAEEICKEAERVRKIKELHFISKPSSNPSERKAAAKELKALETIREPRSAERLYEMARRIMQHDKTSDNQKREEAVALYKEAASLGHTKSQYLVGMYHLQGLNGFKKDKNQGLIWLRMAADAGLEDAAHELEHLDKLQ